AWIWGIIREIGEGPITHLTMLVTPKSIRNVRNISNALSRRIRTLVDCATYLFTSTATGRRSTPTVYLTHFSGEAIAIPSQSRQSIFIPFWLRYKEPRCVSLSRPPLIRYLHSLVWPHLRSS